MVASTFLSAFKESLTLFKNLSSGERVSFNEELDLIEFERALWEHIREAVVRSNENSEDRKRKKLSKRTEDRNKGDMKEITPHFHLFLFIYFFCTFKFNHHLEGTVNRRSTDFRASQIIVQVPTTPIKKVFNGQKSVLDHTNSSNKHSRLGSLIYRVILTTY